MPAYNESNRILPSLKSIVKYLNARKVNYEIIVASDGSRDNTVEVVNNFARRYKQVKLISYKPNKGKGYAVKRGVLNSKGDYVLFSDADLSAPIEELENLMKWVQKGNDFVFGSRGMDESKVKVPQRLYRRVFACLAKIYVHLLMFTFTKCPKDTQCGFKLFTRKSANFLFKRIKTDGGMFDIELIYLAKKFGIKTKEIPVIWMDKPDSKINFIKCVMFDPIDLIKIRIRDFLGMYNK